MKYLIDKPDNWKGPKDCVMCGRYRHICQSRFKDAFECPYTNAVEAVEAFNSDLEEYSPNPEIASVKGFKIDGKPVKLWATEIKGDK